MKKVTRRHAAQFLRPAARNHATSSQDAMEQEKEQPPIRSDPLGERILRYAADATCLVVGALVFLWTHDILAFLLMYAIATRQIQVREVIGMLLSRLPKSQEEPDNKISQ